MNHRFPLNPYPEGWFQIAYSEEVGPGAVKALRYFGRDFVLFRTETGELSLLDAFCAHMGAHLGIGGAVVGEALQCPFHGWRYSPQGICVHIPGSNKIPRQARVARWPLQEVNGLIMTFYHPQGPRAPKEIPWDIPPAAEFSSPEWKTFAFKKDWTIKTHIQEPLENIVDPAHFHSVHGMPDPPRVSVSAEDPMFRSISRTKMRTPRGDIDAEITWTAHGPGYGLIRFSGIVETLFVNAITPIDEETVHLRFSFLQKNKDPEGVRSALIEEICRQVDQDVPIWENKIYREKPLLTAGEETIMKFRAWVRRF